MMLVTERKPVYRDGEVVTSTCRDGFSIPMPIIVIMTAAKTDINAREGSVVLGYV